MKNIKREGWSRFAEPESKTVTYEREQNGIATIVEFDEVTMTYIVATQDLETYENDLRHKAQHSFTNDVLSINHALIFAEKISHHHPC